MSAGEYGSETPDTTVEYPIFKTEALRQRIELINHLMEFGRQLIVINGPARIGKTTLLEAIETAAPEPWVFVKLTAGPTLNRASLIEKVSARLDFEPSSRFDEQDVLDEIRRRLEILGRTKQLVVLAIDDAEQLPIDTYSLLLDLAHNDNEHAELRVLLAADPERAPLAESLQQTAEHSALVHTVELPRLDRNQTASLLSWWAEQQGIDRTFAPSEIDDIFEQSLGIPGDVLVIARQAHLASPSKMRADPVRRYLAAGATVLILVLVGAFLAKDPSDDEVREIAVDLPQPSARALDEPSSARSSTEPLASVPGTPAAADARPPGDTLDEMLAQRLLEHLGAGDKPTATLPAADDGATAQVIAPPSSPAASQADSDVAQDERPAGPSASATSSATERQTDSSKLTVTLRQADNQAGPSAPPLDPLMKPPGSLSQQSASAAASVERAAKSEPSEAQTSAPAGGYSVARLKREAPDGYVLQLFGVRDRQAAQRFIAARGLGQRTAIIAAEHENKPWYVVIFGQYANREQAAQAARNLPQKLADLRPWPRPIATLE